jgi:MFS family permease
MGAVVSLSFFFAVLGQLAFGYITSRMGGKFSILLTSVFPGIAFMLFLLSGSNVYMLAATYSIFTFFAFTGFPVLLGYVNQVVPKSISTTAGGDVWGLGQYVGNGAGIAVISALILAISVYSALWIMLVFLVPSIALIAFLPERGKIDIHVHALRKE